MRRRIAWVMGAVLAPLEGGCASTTGTVRVAAPAVSGGRAYTWELAAGSVMDPGTGAMVREAVGEALERRGWRHRPDDPAATRVTAYVESRGDSLLAVLLAGDGRRRLRSGAYDLSSAGPSWQGSSLDGVWAAMPFWFMNPWAVVVRMPSQGTDATPNGERPVPVYGPSADAINPTSRLAWASASTPSVEEGRVVLVLTAPGARARLLRSPSRVQTLAFWGPRPTAADSAWTRGLVRRAVDDVVADVR
jgi:hypothetical protein